MSIRVNVDQLIADLRSAAQAAGFSTSVYGTAGNFPLLGFVRLSLERQRTQRAVYLSSGIHGDEPAGPLALLELLQERALPEQHDLFICPLMNPNGLAAGTRWNQDGIDLNRDYTDFTALEIQTHRDWAHANIKDLDIALHLHEDWEAKGFYLYELNFSEEPSRAKTILEAVNGILPIEQSTHIDGHNAKEGVIRPSHLTEIEDGLPEAVYFKMHFGGINYTLETPSDLALSQRILALKAATLAAIKP